MNTAVDFLKQKFVMIQWLLNRDEISRTKADELLKQFTNEAKEIEKHQIMRAYDMGNDNQYRKISDPNYKNIDEDEYYEKVMFIYDPNSL